MLDNGGHYMNDLVMIEDELVPVYTTGTGEKVVYGTELHKVLQVKSNYTTWIERRFNDIDAIENENYEVFSKSGINLKGGRPQIEHIIKLDTAKEMAMLERNDKGKQVRRYFISIEKKYKENQNGNNPRFLMCLQGIKFMADDLKIAESSRLFMYDSAFKEFGLPAGFLLHYEDNGNRERCCATVLLERNNCKIKVQKFNNLLLDKGFLQTKERKSSNGKMKTYKSLTDKGLLYGVNLISNKNQKETQPYYYADKFMELYNMVLE